MDEDWRQGSVLEQQKYMLESGLMSDCSFLVGQEPDIKEFRAHKNIMSRSSDVFYAMFYGALRETGVVQVTDITPAAFQALLNHVYCDSLEVSDIEMALSVSLTAHKYNLQPLSNKCTQYMIEHMTSVNVLQVLDFSELTNNLHLRHHCIQLLQGDTEAVLSADSWCNASVSSIGVLLQQDTLNIDSELILFTACQRWAMHQLNVKNQHAPKKAKLDLTLKSIMNLFLPNLRILSLTSKQFLECRKDKDLFSKSKQIAIFKCLADPVKYKVPEGLCELTNSRQKPSPLWYKTLDEVVTQLSSTPFKYAVFSSNGYGLFCSSMTVPIIINKHVLLYGFSYKTLERDKQDTLANTRLVQNVKDEYAEKFTVELKYNDIKCQEYKFDGKLKYDKEKKVYLPKPLLLEKSSTLILKLQFHHHLHAGRKYHFFHKNIKFDLLSKQYVPDDVDIITSNGDKPKIAGINSLLYKVL